MYLVTGGAGFIGSHICELLLKRGDRVRILDNFSSGKLSNISALVDQYAGRIEVIEADIRDRSAVQGAVERVTAVFHQAAIVSVQKSVEDPVETVSVNLEGTVKLLESAQKAGVKKVVFASSTAVYGDSEELPKTEDMAVQPVSPYAGSKYGVEVFANIFSTLYELPVISLRYFNVFGPRQDPTSDYAAVIPKFLSRMLAGKRPVIFGDGEQTRDFVFVEDVARANLLAADSSESGAVFNIASGQSHSLNNLVVVLNEVLGLDFQPVYESPRLGEVRRSLADISLAAQKLGYQPKVPLREGVARTGAWFRKTTEK
ncbi:MAG: SDR family oxidoreductase [Acidobacteria bacterium]|nr:MAG: SDR family oxidoreductase [Acidobacteriota bacterium]